MVRIQKKFSKALKALQFFTTHEWHFESNNVTKLYSKLSEKDKEIFNFNIKQVNWRKYMDNYVLGIRHYILKDDASSLQEAKKNLRKYVRHAIKVLTERFPFWCLHTPFYIPGITFFTKPHRFCSSSSRGGFYWWEVKKRAKFGFHFGR